MLITHRDHPRQLGIGIEVQVQCRAIFEFDFAGCPRIEVAAQVQADPDVGGDQRWQLMVLLRLLQLQQAGVDFLGTAGGMTQAGED
ncbi:hypothetical protein D3C78_1829270 [compost metagenome]